MRRLESKALGIGAFQEAWFSSISGGENPTYRRSDLFVFHEERGSLEVRSQFPIGLLS